MSETLTVNFSDLDDVDQQTVALSADTYVDFINGHIEINKKPYDLSKEVKSQTYDALNDVLHKDMKTINTDGFKCIDVNDGYYCIGTYKKKYFNICDSSIEAEVVIESWYENPGSSHPTIETVVRNVILKHGYEVIERGGYYYLPNDKDRLVDEMFGSIKYYFDEELGVVIYEDDVLRSDVRIMVDSIYNLRADFDRLVNIYSHQFQEYAPDIVLEVLQGRKVDVDMDTLRLYESY